MTAADVFPNVTVLEGVKPVPRTVRSVPPAAGPVPTLRLVSVGTGGGASLGQSSVMVSPTCGGGTGYGPIVAVGLPGWFVSVHPELDACTS